MTAAVVDDYPSSRVSWYAVSVLLAAYTIAFIDRTILSLLVGPIQADLGIGDTAMGLLHGIAFAVFYCFLGLPIARLSDRYSRRWIIFVGMVLWSGMTAICGLAKTFGQLFLARMGVGVGEATLSPAAYSMIADLFPPAKLGRAMGVYSSGVFIGAGIAFLIGGFVISLVSGGASFSIPVFGAMKSWQFVFVIIGVPGIAFALLMLTVPEPRRRGATRVADRIDTRGMVAFIRENPRASLGHIFGFSMLGIVFNGFVAWAPTQMIRDYGVTATQAGTAIGIGLLLFGGGGIIVGGLVSDRLSRKGYSDATMRAGIIGGIGLIPTGIVVPMLPGYLSSAIGYAAFFFFASFPFGAAAAALQLMTPSRLRAQMSALYLLILNLIGIGGGPLMIAATSDYLLAGPASIGTAMAITAAITTPIGVAILVAALPHYRASQEKAMQT